MSNSFTTNKEIYENLVDIIADALMIERSRIIPSARIFSDLEAESIDVVDIRFRIEQKYGFKINQNEMVRSLGDNLSTREIDERFTVDSLASYIEKKLKEPKK